MSNKTNTATRPHRGAWGAPEVARRHAVWHALDWAYREAAAGGLRGEALAALRDAAEAARSHWERELWDWRP